MNIKIIYLFKFFYFLKINKLKNIQGKKGKIKSIIIEVSSFLFILPNHYYIIYSSVIIVVFGQW